MDQFLTFIANNQLLAMLWLAIATLLVVSIIKSKLSKINEINPHELTLLVNRENGVIVDIRNDGEFKKGHIIGSKSLALDKINENNFQGLENSKDKPIIVVCTAGISAVKAANALAKAGFEKVSVLKGGFNAWQSANLPIAK
ncbi:rhodanese-like domain-containing protein [Thalassotalea ponticola]|uniref:rhodanese-like domain-containing protein n=1 Tax=Thalassotalea ponticola TaxID=1523392 RepID=UPI0025B50DCD|nr:rhodanese-like domain-containing protein [Thalassotalea ponticola]MDN3652405.1 rhodanese-like domain-containing protein [Thalassotalea ponticola]